MSQDNQQLASYILKLARSERHITDIHIESGKPIRTKEPGGWELDKEFGDVTKEALQGFISTTWGENYMEQIKSKGALDQAVAMDDYRLRINAFTTMEGQNLALSVRKHLKTPVTFESLEISQPMKNLIKMSSRGLFVFCGSTGSAKSTSLAAIIKYFNKDAKVGVSESAPPRKLHIHTIDDPIEFVHEPINAVITQKSVGSSDCPDYATGLLNSLRQRPDIIVIGEVRDRKTCETMLSAAESGHLVFATMHTNSAIAAVNKILSFFPEDQHKMILTMLSSNLLGVVCQAMMPKIGLDGWVVASESFQNSNQKVTDLIASGDINGILDILRAGAGSDFVYLNHKLRDLVKSKVISADAAIRASYQPVELVGMLRVS